MSEIDIRDIFDNDMKVIRMTPDDPPKASCVDFVMAVTGQDNDRAQFVFKDKASGAKARLVVRLTIFPSIIA
jgi:hypothetical protein